MNADSPIGVFDSGVGGLSVLRHLVHVMPSERYVYLGDTARVPYGNKSVETVQHYARQCTEFLLQKSVKLIIIACNTASAVALDVVREVSTVPVIDVIGPSAHAAYSASLSKRIGIIGTRATIGSKAYDAAIAREAAEMKPTILGQACPLFVPLAEEGWTAHPATRAIAREYMKAFVEAGVDTVVLGCTHYPLLVDVIHEAIPQASLIDPGLHAALSAHDELARTNLLRPQSEVPVTEVEYYVTDIPATFPQVAKQFLGFDVPSPRLVHFED